MKPKPLNVVTDAIEHAAEGEECPLQPVGGHGD
jgi:hypothetical protein